MTEPRARGLVTLDAILTAIERLDAKLERHASTFDAIRLRLIGVARPTIAAAAPAPVAKPPPPPPLPPRDVQRCAECGAASSPITGAGGVERLLIRHAVGCSHRRGQKPKGSKS